MYYACIDAQGNPWHTGLDRSVIERHTAFRNSQKAFGPFKTIKLMPWISPQKDIQND